MTYPTPPIAPGRMSGGNQDTTATCNNINDAQQSQSRSSTRKEALRQQSLDSTVSPQDRKRPNDEEIICESIEPLPKRVRRSSIEPLLDRSINYWVTQKSWPREFFQQDPMDHLLARKRSVSVLHRKRSDGSLTKSVTPSDQRPREEKSVPYKSPSYGKILETQSNSYMRPYELGISNKSEQLCRLLETNTQPLPTNTIFSDDAVFKATCNKLQGKNEARIFKDLTPLIVPSAEILALLEAKHLENVVESVNEGWNSCMCITTPRPQPDYAVGFGRNAFSDDQLNKLQPYIGDPTDISPFMATYYMHFPFLTCEVKCGTAGLDIADQQNAHSMTIAVKAIVNLFRMVGREQEINQEILAFSYSHDDEAVRIWGHYATIDGEKTSFWRHPLRRFYFQDRAGLERWVAFTFTRNIYDLWVQPHLKRIRSAIDDIHLIHPEQSDLRPSETSGLSQQFEQQGIEEDVNDRSGLHLITPDTLTETQRPATQKRKKVSHQREKE